MTLKEATEQYAQSPSQEAMREVLRALLTEAYDGKNVHVPLCLDKDGVYYQLIDCNDGKSYYAVCTDPVQLSHAPCASTAVIAVADILNKLPKVEEVGGICINPWDKTPCFIPTVIISQLLSALNQESAT